ncbi:MAG: hypothetical protein JM58_11825 [Peptococcaceae bacterium BICA1-8]|nr:MAG: hypothetical protein JM58_11825 [Peptococcaceae bacterium BICA1-8]
MCTLHLAVTSFGATLDMDGWLGLTQQGLSPCKNYQASLGVLTVLAIHELLGWHSFCTLLIDSNAKGMPAKSLVGAVAEPRYRLVS